jgi:periplasmic divalent cation tolerance protein
VAGNKADILRVLCDTTLSVTMSSTRPAQQLVLSTCPSAAVAKRLARRLVEERLAACVNILPLAQSIYRWRGKVESAREWLLIIKSRRTVYPRLEARLRELHPYELPEIIAVPIARGLAAYLAWIDNPDKA